jgi:hypothetical protein
MIKFHQTPVMFPACVASPNPDAIVKSKMSVSDEFIYGTVRLEGEFYRVAPSSAREIFFLANLEKYREKWAPAKGDGILVSAEVINQLKR